LGNLFFVKRFVYRWVVCCLHNLNNRGEKMTKNIQVTLVSLAVATLIALAASAAVPGLVPVENSFPSAVGMMAAPIEGGGGGS
jgi:hypothetical protein